MAAGPKTSGESPYSTHENAQAERVGEGGKLKKHEKGSA